jgi:hypothetical protein
MTKKISVDSVRLMWEVDELSDCEDLMTDVVDGKIARSTQYSDKDIQEFGYEKVMGWIGYDLVRYSSYGPVWWHYTVHAEAKVSYECGGKSRRLEKLSSRGVGKIDSDSSKEYFFEVAVDELQDLRVHLEEFGVDTGNFDEVIAGINLYP